MTECKRFIPIEEPINGQSMVIDWTTQAVIPQKEARCHGDCVRRARCELKDAVIPDIEPFEIVLPGGHATPEEALEMSKKILGNLKAPAPTKLRVSDLSVISAEEKKRDAEWLKKKVNRTDAVTIGDLSKVED